MPSLNTPSQHPHDVADYLNAAARSSEYFPAVRQIIVSENDNPQAMRKRLAETFTVISGMLIPKNSTEI